MGTCQSTETVLSRRIDRHIAQEERQDQRQKLLILGAGESGKSTILKQLRLMHCEGFSSEELEARKTVIYSNIVGQMAAIITAMEALGIPLDNVELQRDSNLVTSAVETNKESERPSASIVAAIRALWMDAGVQRSYQRRAEFQLNDSARFFIESIDRIAADNYIPSQQDMLYSRVATTGVVQVDFTIQGFDFSVYDVGGQRTERKKWIHYFEDVTAVLYVAAVSEFDQKLREDDSTNRLQETLILFDAICNNRYFANSSMILFLNKADLLKEKIENDISLRICFPNYNGGNSYEEAVAFIRVRFEALNKNKEEQQPLYTFETCATDCTQVQKVVHSVIDIIIQKALTKAGII